MVSTNSNQDRPELNRTSQHRKIGKWLSAPAGQLLSGKDAGNSEANMFSKYPQPMRKWTYCGLFDEYSFTFSPLGELYKCWEMVGDNKHKMGYIKDDGTLTDVTFAYYDWLSIDPLKEPDCSDCKYLPICGGGCRMLSYRQTGTYHAAGCEKVKGVIEKQIEVYVRRQVQFQNN